jgi:predicted small secreted protein
MMKKLVVLIAIIGVTVCATTGCNTVEGAGKDIKAAGGAVEKAAEKTRSY